MTETTMLPRVGKLRRVTGIAARAFCCLAMGALALSPLGCHDPYGGLSRADHDKARDALDKALTAWRNGEPATKWAAETAPIRFVDDSWIKGHALVDYQIVSIRANIDGYPEAVVRVTIQPKGAPRRESEALYGINLRKANQVSIGRDPMYNR
jgi:hypothetical protein